VGAKRISKFVVAKAAQLSSSTGVHTLLWTVHTFLVANVRFASQSIYHIKIKGSPEADVV